MSKRKLIFLAIIVIGLIMFIYFLIENNNKKNNIIIEPNAPIAKNVSVSELTFKYTSTMQLVPLYEYPTPNIKFSPDKKHLLVDFSGDESDLPTLLTDLDGNVLRTIGIDLDSVDFANNNFVIYLNYTAELFRHKETGIYLYNIKSQISSLISTDTDFPFTLHLFINDNTYFYTKYKTGEIGFKSLNSNNNIVLDKKLAWWGSGAYGYPTLSPDDKYISVIDESPIKDSDVDYTVKIFPSNATSIYNLYFSTNLKSNSPLTSKKVTWSKDSRYLTINGEDGTSTLIDVMNRSIKLNLSDSNSNLILSPDDTKYLIKDNSTLESYIINANDNSNTSKLFVAKNVKDERWIDNTHIILIIGKKLYIYDLVSLQLEAVNIPKTKHSISIQDIDSSKHIAIITMDQQVFTISIHV